MGMKIVIEVEEEVNLKMVEEEEVSNKGEEGEETPSRQEVEKETGSSSRGVGGEETSNKEGEVEETSSRQEVEEETFKEVAEERHLPNHEVAVTSDNLNIMSELIKLQMLIIICIPLGQLKRELTLPLPNLKGKRSSLVMMG